MMSNLFKMTTTDFTTDDHQTNSKQRNAFRLQTSVI